MTTRDDPASILIPNRRTSSQPAPPLKWLGGKRQLLQELMPRTPPEFGTYFEPFSGGAALFWALQPKAAVLGDSNARLIRTYRAIRDDVEDVIELLSIFRNDAAHYRMMADEDFDRFSDVEVATWLLYLNRTCFNGVYRVNKKGIFNVPFGKQQNPTICNARLLRDCSTALAGKTLLVADFEESCASARSGDFAYFDPPYIPLSASSNFTGYTAKGFDLDDHVRLRNLALDLGSRGVHVLLSNSDTPTVRELYADDFTIEVVRASRQLSCRASTRGAINEVLITPSLRQTRPPQLTRAHGRKLYCEAHHRQQETPL